MKGTLLFLLFSLVVIVSCDKINFDNEQLDSIIRTKVELGAKIHHIAENLVESKVHYVVKKGALDALEYHKHSVSQLHLRKDLAQHADDLHMKLREFEIKLLEKDNNYFSVFNKRNLEDSNNSTQLKSNLLDLLSNFPQAKTWLAECNTATCINFIIELAGDNRDYYVAEFLELMISLNFTSPGITPELQDNFVLVMLQLFYKQTEHNPPLYVSHGTDHSVRAMSWVDQLQTLVDEGLETTYGSYSKNHSKFMLYLNTILHDTGYIWIESPKFLHAAASGILTDQFITTNTTNVGALMLNESAELNENLINDFIFALSTHNYDDQLCLFKTGDEYSKCLYIYEPAKKNITGITKNYTRDYVPVNAISKPFGFVVRIADNFDATYYRLTITQRHEFLVQFWLRLYTDFDLRTAVANKVDQNPALSAARENALNSMPELKAYYEDTNSQVKDIVDKSNSESFLHFYSNWIVQNMTYDNYVLTVNFRNPVEEELRYYHHPGPALYQVNRLASSMLSCYTASNTSFIDAIQVELNPPLPNATKSRFSLRSFTKKPIYDENGKNGFICTPHCDDLSFLTISPEPCLTYVNGQIAVSKECPYVDFGKVSPYSDLSYPNTTQTTSTTTSSTTGESVETSGSSIVTLCAFVMLFNLLVVVLF